MAPVTRRAAKAQSESGTPRESPASTPTTTKKGAEALFEDTIALRSKRGPPSTTGDEDVVATPRRKKLEVRLRREEGPAHFRSSIEVQIPSSAIKTPRSKASPVPDSQATATTDEGSQSFEPLSASRQLEEEATQSLAQSRLLQSSQETATPLSKATRAKRGSTGKRSNKKPVTAEEPEADETPRPKAVAKSTHVVFGDDDDVDKFVAAAAEKEQERPPVKGGDEDEHELEESDDEAPEAVSTAAAAKQTLKSARAAIEAAENYAATTKKKRQARDNLLKQQATKRKRTETSTSGKEGRSSDEEGGESDEDGKTEESKMATSKRQRRPHSLPNLLPAEFLTDSSEDEDETALKEVVQRPQKITFETAMQALGAEGKGPRDEIVGLTRYRVLAKQGDPRLAPKANKQSGRIKEDLIRRGRSRVELNKKRGFFVKK
ncbi:hypothetical protein F4808DRAFT_461640 [Astrocystis sublimbata]|nr:hypothetical protein F4808DRAFT_461640 [Astrocystis sublimbata]